MARALQSWVVAPAAAGFIALPAIAGIISLTVSAPARADLTGVAEAGVGYSDNIGRVPANETDETIGTLGVELTWAERSRRIRGDADIDLSYFEYMDNTYDSEVLGTANGTLGLAIVPETLQWVFQDSFGQAQSDPFAPSTPETRENLNYFSTGPDLTVRLGSTGFGRLFGRWSTTAYERSPLDADRTTGGVAFGRRASPRSEVSLNAVTESVDFDQAINTDFDRDSVYVGWNLDASRTVIDAQVGYTWLQRDGADQTGNALVNVVVTRDLTASSVLALTLGTQLGDAGDSLRTELQGGVVGGGGSQITATADPFENRVVSLEWRYLRGRNGFSLGASWNKDDYETQRQLNRKRMAYTASLTRQLATTLDFELLGTLEHEDFDTLTVDADELRMQALLNWRAWRTMGIRLSAERYDRDTSNGTGEYEENRVFLTLAYYWGAADATRR